jgi:hypothetical protein
MGTGMPELPNTAPRTAVSSTLQGTVNIFSNSAKYFFYNLRGRPDGHPSRRDVSPPTPGDDIDCLSNFKRRLGSHSPEDNLSRPRMSQFDKSMGTEDIKKTISKRELKRLAPFEVANHYHLLLILKPKNSDKNCSKSQK